MAQVTKSALASSISNLITTNGTGQVSAADVRSVLNDMVDSSQFPLNGSGPPATTPNMIGAIYVDTDGPTFYQAKGTSSSADWVRMNSIPEFRPETYGSVSGDASAAFNAMYAAVNAGSGPCVVRLDGTYTYSNPTAVTRNDVVFDARGSKHTKTGNWRLLEVNGDRCTIIGGEWDGASGSGYSGTNIDITGDFSGVQGAYIHHSGGAGLTFSEGAVAPWCRDVEVHDTGNGGIAAGKTTNPRVMNVRVYNTGGECIQFDEVINGILDGFDVWNGGGGGGVGCDRVKGLFIMNGASHNHVGGAKDGIRVFDNRPDLTLEGRSSIGVVIANTRTYNCPGYGIRLRSAYTSWPISSITLGSVTRVAFQQFDISGVTLGTDIVRITCTAHGLTVGTWLRGHTNNITGTTELNGVKYWWYVEDANTLRAYDEVTGEPIDGSTGFTAYVSGGKLNHGFETGDRMVIADAGGVTELEGTVFQIELTVGSVLFSVDLKDNDTGADINSTGYTAYSSGGRAYVGGMPYGCTLMGNTFGTGVEANTLGNWMIDFEGGLLKGGHVVLQDGVVQAKEVRADTLYLNNQQVLAANDPQANVLWGNKNGVGTQAVTVGTGLSFDGDTLTGATASDSVVGVVKLATVAEADAHTATNLAVTPAGLAKRVKSDPTGVTGADAVTNIMSLTQAEYDAIGTPNASTLYVITA